MGPKLFFSDPDSSFQEISDPAQDPTKFLSQEAKVKILNKTAAQILILKKRFLKPNCEFCCPYSKINS